MSAPAWAIEGPEDITAAAISALLGLDVTSVEAERVGTGQIGTCYRLTLTGEGVPTRLMLKLPTADAGARDLYRGTYRSEVLFYDRLASTVAVRVPQCHVARFDEETAHFVLLLEDLAPLEPGEQIAGASPERVLDAAINLAGLHGPRWCDPSLLEVPGLAPTGEDDAQVLADLFGPATDIFLDRLGPVLAPGVVEVLQACPSVSKAWALGRPERFGLVHGDYRLDNLMFTPGGGRGEVAALDWQTLTLALPARDLAFLVTTSLEPDVRRAVERDLVAAYHQGLLEHGVPETYDLQACWDDYVFAMLQAPLIIVFGCAYGTRTERGDRMFATMATRACTAMRDLAALDLLAGSAAT